VLIAHAVGSADVEDTTLGVERNVAYLAAAQRRRGHEVSILMNAPGAFRDACAELGMPVVVAPELQLAGDSLASPDEPTMARLTARFKELGPDLIHCHSLGVALNAIPAGNRLGIPCVFDCEMLAIVTAAQRIGMQFATISCCRQSFEEITKGGVEEAYFVPTGTPTVTVAGPRQPGGANLIFVGSIQVRKGLDVALAAMGELRRRRGGHCPVLNIYGSGAEESYLKEVAALSGLEDVVKFRGFESGVLERCAGSDILLLPSRMEHAPLVVLEAMSRGMPVVATDVGDVAEMIPDQRFGRIVAAGAVRALADAIESMLADIEGERFDPRQPVERHRAHYSTDVLAENTWAVYEQVLQSSPR